MLTNPWNNLLRLIFYNTVIMKMRNVLTISVAAMLTSSAAVYAQDTVADLLFTRTMQADSA